METGCTDYILSFGKTLPQCWINILFTYNRFKHYSRYLGAVIYIQTKSLEKFSLLGWVNWLTLVPKESLSKHFYANSLLHSGCWCFPWNMFLKILISLAWNLICHLFAFTSHWPTAHNSSFTINNGPVVSPHPSLKLQISVPVKGKDHAVILLATKQTQKHSFPPKDQDQNEK